MSVCIYTPMSKQECYEKLLQCVQKNRKRSDIDTIGTYDDDYIEGSVSEGRFSIKKKRDGRIINESHILLSILEPKLNGEFQQAGTGTKIVGNFSSPLWPFIAIAGIIFAYGVMLITGLNMLMPDEQGLVIGHVLTIAIGIGLCYLYSYFFRKKKEEYIVRFLTTLFMPEGYKDKTDTYHFNWE